MKSIWWFWNIKDMIKENCGGFLFGYIFGYIVCIANTGIPKLIYLIPIKILAILISYIVGHLFYFASKKASREMSSIVLIVRLLQVNFVLCIIFFTFECLHSAFNIDFVPFIGGKINDNM